MTRLLVLLLLAGQAVAQPVDPNPRALGLALLRARGELALADSVYARSRQLFDRQMISPAELEARQAERERAAIGVLESWAAVSAAVPRLRVLRAIKVRALDGGTVARLRVAAVGEDEALAAGSLASLPGDLLDRLRMSASPDAFLSIKDDPGPGGTAIGVPYEQRIPVGAATIVRDLEFRLLRDADAVVVSMSSGGRVDERKVWLEADVSGAISVQPLPFSQEADLGAEAAYDLTIERMGGGDPLRLAVHGLPSSVSHHFTDAESGARIGQLRFSAGEQQRRVRLTLSLPEGDAGTLVVDSAYRFLMIADPERRDRGRALAERAAAEWRKAGAGVAELEVVPRGVGRAELRAFNLFHEVSEGERVAVELVVRNAGSRVIDRVRVLAELPPGWTSISDPADLRDLRPNAEHAVRLSLAPVAGADLGDYEARLRIEGSSGRTRLGGDPTVLRVRLRAKSGGATTIVLLGVVVAGAAGAVMLTRRMARR